MMKKNWITGVVLRGTVKTFWIAAQLHAAMTALLTKLFMGLIA